ncbi:MAG: hypothetical protein ABFS03_03960 [Chloroflexota bacterium]
MSVSGAITRLLALSVTGVQSNAAVSIRPIEFADLPALRLDEVAQPFVGGLKAWNVAATKGTVTVLYDHMLLISGGRDGRNIDRWDNRLLYFDRYLSAIAGDLTLNGELTEPLGLVMLKQGQIQLGHRFYDGLVFRHLWKLRIT